MPVRKVLLALSLIVLLLIGCTNRLPPVIPTVAQLPTATPVPPTPTPHALPPTWTPSPPPPPSCDQVIARAAAAAAPTCQEAGIGEACLVAVRAGASARADNVAVDFVAPGDRAPLTLVGSVYTLAYDPAGHSWGLATIRVPADPPGVAPGQWVTAVMYGDATITDTGAGTAPFQDMIVRTGYEDSQCARAPLPAVIFQNSTGQEAGLTINGLAARFTGTVLVRAQANGQMHLVVLSGQAQVTAPDGSSLTAPAGAEVHTPLGGGTGFAAVGPLALVPLNNAQIAYLPLAALPQTVAIGPPLQPTAIPRTAAAPTGPAAGGQVQLPGVPTEEPSPTPAVPFQGTPPDGIRTYSGKRITPGQTVTGSIPADGRDAWVFEPVGLAPDSYDSFEVQALGGWDPVLTIESATWGVYAADYDGSPGEVEVYTASLAGSGGDWRIVIRDAQGRPGGYILRYTCFGPCAGD